MPLTPCGLPDAYLPLHRLQERQGVYPLDLYLCRGCGHVQMLDIVDPAILFSGEYRYLTGSTPAVVRHFEEYADRVIARVRPAHGSWAIDVGSNDGTLLGFFKARGHRVLGIDAAKEVAAQATAAGIETIPEFLTPQLAERVRREYGPAAVVTCNNAFAHADDLAGMADCIRDLLAEDGVFVFEVSYVLDIVDKMLLGTIFHEHLSHHSVKPMVLFLRRHGMELIDVHRVSLQGGSFIGTAQLASGRRPVDASVGAALALEAERRLDRPEVYREFSARLEQAKAALLRILEDLKGEGKKIAGFGAARGGTTMLFHFELNRFLEFIVDDNPAKQNTFSPVHHIPVLPTRALFDRRPDYVFILAWVHARPIIEKYSAFRTQGGRFIVPLPQPEVV